MNTETMKPILKHFFPTADVWSLSGPANKERRRDLIERLTGERRPLAKCGINEVRNIVIVMANIQPGTIAAEDSEIRALILGGPK